MNLTSRLNSVLFGNVTYSNTLEFKCNPQFYNRYKIQTQFRSRYMRQPKTNLKNEAYNKLT